jgi:CheY-like chemotaxis protein
MVAAEQINSKVELHQPEAISVEKTYSANITERYQDILTFKILIAEHCAFNRHLIETFLRCHGYNVISTRDGLEALQRFYYDSTPFDLVIADINMPGMNGNILARHIHNLDSAIPILALSDSTAKMGEYFDGIITKPIQLPGLLQMVEGSLPHP